MHIIIIGYDYVLIATQYARYLVQYMYLCICTNIFVRIKGFRCNFIVSYVLILNFQHLIIFLGYRSLKVCKIFEANLSWLNGLPTWHHLWTIYHLQLLRVHTPNISPPLLSRLSQTQAPQVSAPSLMPIAAIPQQA